MSDRHDRQLEELLRVEAPQVLGALVRRYGHFDVAEDAVQEALLAAARQWAGDGVPDRPRSWLIRVASRAMIDVLRSDYARRDREEHVSRLDPTDQQLAAAVDSEAGRAEDDSLILLFLCCDPVLSQPSQIALTLRAVGGLTTEEIARAFLVPDATMGQRISRAKQTIKKSGARFHRPAPEDLPARLAAVLRVLYLIFNEGYVASSGNDLSRNDLSAEAIRLTRLLRLSLPDEGEVSGLLALMLLTDARRLARVSSEGSAIPIAEQDRGRWRQDLIGEGTQLVDHAMAHTKLGPYQIQGAIAALHDAAGRPDQTDWLQILALYTLLERFDDSPMVVLNKAVATAMVQGPEAGLTMLAELKHDERLAQNHRLTAVRGHLYEMAGDFPAAIADYRAAARRTTSTPERRHLRARAARLPVEVALPNDQGRVGPARTRVRPRAR